MNQFNKFVPLTKMEETKDGTLMVYGTVTAEEPDLVKEVCDYEKTKPYYQAKVEKMFKLTSAVDGMSPSIMPMREMHQLKSIGAGRSIEFDDIGKKIRMGFEVVDPDAITKFRKGVLIGFSQGGDYIGGLVDDPKFAGCKRYVADPQEVSGVDAPCLPSALVDAMKGRTVTLQKAAGGTEEVALQVDRLDRMEKLLEGLVELQKRDFSSHERQHDAGTGAALPDGSFPIENEQDLKNAIHAIGRAKDPAKARAHIEARAKSLGLTHLLPDGWGGSEKGENNMELTKAQRLEKAKSMGAHLEALKAAHEKHHEAMNDHIEKCMKCMKEFSDDAGGEQEHGNKGEKTAAELALAKAADDRVAALEASIAEMAKSHKELMEKLAKMPAPGVAHTGAVTEEVNKARGPAVPAGYEDLLNPPVTH